MSCDNRCRYINISQVIAEHDESILQALLGLYIFTTAFWSKGKQKPLDLMLKSKAHTAAMVKLGECPDFTNDHISEVKKLVFALYGMPKVNSADDGRYAFCQQKYAPSHKSQSFQKIKGINQCSMPPCRIVLVTEVHRANYITPAEESQDGDAICSECSGPWVVLRSIIVQGQMA